MEDNYRLILTRSDTRQLHAQLRVVQRRLGTPAEAPGDIDRANALVHELNNLLTVVRLQEELRSLPGVGAPASPPPDLRV